MKRKLLPIALAVMLVGFIVLGITNIKAKDHKVEIKEIQLRDKSIELQEVRIQYQQLDQKYQQVDQTKQEEVQKLQEEKKQLEERTKQLEADLQAKAKRQNDERIALQNAANRATGTATALAASGGSCASWIAAAGISDTANANELIRRESGCNPNAVNKSSGACGVAQELPCGKSGCSMGDGACQVRWMNGYVVGRYGSWAAAVGFHDRNNWY